MGSTYALLECKREDEVVATSDSKRRRPTTRPGDHRLEFERDFDRAIFSTPVKRLQDKAQVFPLDPNDSIRDAPDAFSRGFTGSSRPLRRWSQINCWNKRRSLRETTEISKQLPQRADSFTTWAIHHLDMPGRTRFGPGSSKTTTRAVGFTAG